MMGQAHTAGDILEMRRGPEQRCTGCRGGCRERAAQPRHRRSRAPPEPAPCPGSPGSAAPLRGLQRRDHRHLPVLGCQGVMEHELVAGRIISPSSTSVTLRVCCLTDVLAGI